MVENNEFRVDDDMVFGEFWRMIGVCWERVNVLVGGSWIGEWMRDGVIDLIRLD